MHKKNYPSSGTLPSGKKITGATMNAFRKLKTLALFAGAIFMSAPPAYAEDIEIYLYENEGGGSNVLLVIDNSGATHRNFPDTPTAPDGKTTIDEIKYALTQVIGSVSGNTRLGVAAQLDGGTNGGAIYYPVKQIEETISPTGSASVIGNDGEVSQGFDLTTQGALPVAFMNATWGTFDDGSTGKLPLPSILSTTEKETALAVTLSALNVPRYAKVDSAVLTFSSPSTDQASTDGFQARVAYESNAAPAVVTDLSSLNVNLDFDSGFNAKGSLYEGTITMDVTAAVQAAVSDPMWCGNQDLRLIVMATDIPSASVPAIYTNQALDADNQSLGRTALKVGWDASTSMAPPATATGDDTKSCMGGVTITLNGASDDAVETDAGGNLLLSEPDLVMANVTSGAQSSRGNYIAGARFAGITYGQNTVVSNAILSGEITNKSDASAAFSVTNMLGDVAEFANDGDITSNPLGTKTVTVSDPVGPFSVDITDLVNETFADGSWAAGNAMGLFLKRTSGDSISLHAIDNGAVSGLKISMDILAKSASEFGAAFNRSDGMKAAVEEFSNNTGGGNRKPASTYTEAGAYMLGISPKFGKNYSHIDAFENASRSNYLSPGEDYDSCGGNHIIMVSHAESSGESFKTAINDITGTSDCAGDANSDAWQCASVLAKFLAGNDITTHTIAFAPSKQETYDGLELVAKAGGGEWQRAANGAELAEKLSDLINKLTTTDASMAAPGVAVNQLNRFSHLDQLYYALFRPDFKTRWQGNLKRYRVDFNSKTIVDETGAGAVDTDGFFKDTASSWWSTVVDGGNVTLGGSRARTLTNGNRKLLVSRTSPAPGGSSTATSSVGGQTLDTIASINDVSRAELGLAATATDADLQEHVDFLLTSWGDPLHTEPRLVNYGYSGTFEEAAEDASKQDNVVFVATNDGILHAIDPATGDEHFAYIPGEELAKTASRFDPVDVDTADPRRSTYGLDGGITIWRRSNASDPSQNPEHVFLYVGQRRGGKAYYAIDATNKTSPKIMWKIDATQADFQNLGQTWSTPTLTQVMIGGTPVPVLVFGGGYSEQDHDDKTNVSGGDVEGNSIFMVNAFTGKLIWSASDSGASDTNADMKWSIPASVASVDIDYDGFADHLYATDLGGQIFRVDINNSNSGTNGLITRVTTLAKLGTSSSAGMANNRRFYAAPAVSINARSDGTPFLQVGIGSGYRTYPLSQETDNFIYVVEDYDAMNDRESAAITHTDLVDVTSNTSPDESLFSGNKGWMIKLPNLGEKVLSSPVISSGVMYVTSYLPDSVFQDACNRVVGSSRLYALNIIDGSPGLDFDNDGSLERSTDIELPGLPPSPQVLLDGTDETTLIIGTEALKGGQLNAGKGVRKTRWFEVNSKQDADAALQN